MHGKGVTRMVHDTSLLSSPPTLPLLHLLLVTQPLLLHHYLFPDGKANHPSQLLRLRLSDVSNVEESVIFALNAPLLMKMLSTLQLMLSTIMMMKNKLSLLLLMKLKLKKLGNYFSLLVYSFLLLLLHPILSLSGPEPFPFTFYVLFPLLRFTA